jgi:TRAP-type uncharacterized transport system fused permease subunit
VIAIVLILIVLEMARRAIGWPLPLVAAIAGALLYGLFGQYIPASSAMPARRSQASWAR